MSYAITDAGEQDMRAELKVLQELNEELDQLANPSCTTLCPEVETLIDLAWWFTEAAIREATGTCSAHNTPPLGCCPCCRHFNELRPKAEHLRRML